MRTLLPGLIQRLEDVTTRSDISNVVTDVLPEAFGAAASVVVWFDRLGNQADMAISGLPSSVAADYERYAGLCDEVRHAAIARKTCIDCLQLYTAEEWERHPLYLNLGVPAKVRSYLVTPVVSRGSVVGVVGAARSGDARPYAPLDREVALLISVHLSETLARIQGEDELSPAVAKVLSPREREIVTQVRRSRTNKEIAYLLGISHDTVRVLVHRACQKLGVRGRKELDAV